MSFVFYDTETTGTSTSFDQILQFAAIRSDDDLVETDRFEIRCRLRPHVLPHPMALRVTGMTMGRVTDPALHTHYEMMRRIRTKLMEWSPAIFVGYNSIGFDEHLLRQALFATLHPPYLTNTDGNTRADALPLIQAAVALSPGCIAVPTGDNGRPSFKLDRLAPANGFAHDNAHDALADVEATIHMARLIREREPACWSRFVRFSSKAEVEGFMDEEHAFFVTQVFFNRAYHFPVARLGTDPANPSAALCLDLNVDPDRLAAMDAVRLAAFVARSPKPIRRVKVNSCPSIAALDEVASSFLHPHTRERLINRAKRISGDGELRRRLIEAFATGRREYPEPVHVEEQLYTGFPPPADEARMNAFHDLEWELRAELVEAFEDVRLRHHGRLLVHEHAPTAMAAPHRLHVEDFVHGRLHAEADGTNGWTSLHGALAAVDALIAEHGVEDALTEYRSHVVQRIEAGRVPRAR